MLRMRIDALHFILICGLTTCFISPNACFGGQGTGNSPTRLNGDVVVLALRSLDEPSEDHRKHLREMITADPDLVTDLEEQLLDVQMEILRKTAVFGPVLLIVPDEATENTIREDCKELRICDLLRSDNIRIKVVRHSGIWIRDFGPQIEAVNGSAHVTHWRYFDNRAEEAKREELQELYKYLETLIKTRVQQDEPDVFVEESSTESHRKVAEELDSRINLIRVYIETRRERSVQRIEDESSAFDVADAVLADPNFKYASSPVALDGGNLLRLDDKRCLSTRVLLSRNKDQSLNLSRDLKDVGGCKETIFLDPLPGPVIEHVDMLALPVGGNRILLASYDLSQPLADKYWGELSRAERDLAVNAAVVMDRNAEGLRKLGYDVVSVPSPFPRITKHGDVYYPTVVNALVRQGANGESQVLVPSYKGYEQDIQDAALSTIAEAFGPNTEVAPIEATAAAKAQGAVHCLTITVPLSLSIFNDSYEKKSLDYYSNLRDQLDRANVAQVTSQIPSSGVEGFWAMLDQDEQPNSRSIDSSPSKIYFGPQEFEIGLLDKLVLKGKYAIKKRDGNSWSLRIQFPDQGTSIATVQWLGRNSAELTFEDAGETWLLEHLDSDSATPFQDDDSSDRTVPSAGTKSTDHSKHHVVRAARTKAATGKSAL